MRMTNPEPETEMTATAKTIEMLTAAQAHEMIHLADGFGGFPPGTAFYLLLGGAKVRVSVATADDVLLSCCQSGRLNGKVTGEAVAVVRYDRVGLMVDIG